MRNSFWAVMLATSGVVAGCPPEELPGSANDGGQSACATVRCAAGTHCEETEVQCIQAPCPPLVECVADAPSVTCANVRCSAGTTCVDTSTGPECQPDADAATCATTLMLCADGTTCVDTPNGPECQPAGGDAGCAAVLCIEGTFCVEGPDGAECLPNEPEPACDVPCEAGQHCELVEVQCFAPPCDPVPSCVDDTVYGCELIDCQSGYTCVEDDKGNGSCVAPDSCGEPESCAAATCPVDTYCDDISGKVECIPNPSCNTVKCSAGHHCELQDVTCVRAPCPPQPSCVADEPGVACGENTCAAGLVCCNASCGICTPPDGVCIQLACE